MTKKILLIGGIIILFAGVATAAVLLFYQQSDKSKNILTQEPANNANSNTSAESGSPEQSALIDQPTTSEQPESSYNVKSTLTPKDIFASALKEQDALSQYKAIYSMTISEKINSETVPYMVEEDKQDNKLRHSAYKGVLHESDGVFNGFTGKIFGTTYQFLDKNISVSCLNIEQSCQSSGNSYAEIFSRAFVSQGAEIQSLSKLLGAQVYGEPNLMIISNNGTKNIEYTTSVSGKDVAQSSVCNLLNITFIPAEVKKLSSPSGEVSYTTIDPLKSKFNINVCIDRTNGLIGEYEADIDIASPDDQHSHMVFAKKLLGFSSEIIDKDAFPFPSKIEDYAK